MELVALVFLLMSLPVTQSVTHSLTYLFTTSTELRTFPEFVAVALVDGVVLGSCDSTKKKVEIKQDWVKTLTEKDPDHITWNTEECRTNYRASRTLIEDFNWLSNQSQGVHVLQEVTGCEVDDDVNKATAFDKLGYDGEDFMYFDITTGRWIYTEKSAVLENKGFSYFYIDSSVCLGFLKKYLEYGNSTLERKVPPSVSLLQKSPSSPISCYATGFYPNRADMFWRRDGEQTHEDVDHGEILPNPDGTFQMRVDLDLSSVRAEDWSRYDCVFKLSGVKDDVITKLDQAVIRTNQHEDKPGSLTTALVTVVVVVVVLDVIIVSGVMFYKKKAADADTNTDTDSELLEGLSLAT